MLVMKFSSGMCQRLGIARALLKQPSVILLDEPTRSLDPVSTEKFWDMIRELPGEKATVVIATHSFQEAAAVADSVAILQRGELAAYINVRGRSAQDLRFLYAQTTGTPTHEFALERCS